MSAGHLRSLALAAVSALSLSGAATASAAAFATAEHNSPSGAYSQRAPKGTVMVIHGGGWEAFGAAQVALLRPEVKRFTRQGWATLNVDYSPFGQGPPDVLAQYDTLRARSGSKRRICLYGQSAGGHLALMVAIARPDVACVITEGAPADLPSLATQTAYDKNVKGGSPVVSQMATAAFGAGNLRANSPLTYASRLGARTLMSTATTDFMVSRQQMDAMGAARPDKVTVRSLRGTAKRTTGATPFTHANVTRSARKSWEASKRRLLASTL